MLLVAAGPGGSLALTGVLDGEKNPPADLVRFVPPAADPFIFICGALCVGVFLAVVAHAGRKAAAVPTWFSVLGYVAAAGMLGAVFVVPIFLLPIWAVAAAYVLPR